MFVREEIFVSEHRVKFLQTFEYKHSFVMVLSKHGAFYIKQQGSLPKHIVSLSSGKY